MSRVPPAPVPVSRPTGIDYLLILLGCSLSLALHQISGPVPRPKEETSDWVKQYLLSEQVPVLALMLTLPQGIILFWPVFYGLQRLAGRPQALSAGEWLLGVAWLGTLLVTAWSIWMSSDHPPDFARKLTYPPPLVWNVIVIPTMALLAVVIGMISLFARWKQPWTHTFGLVLIIWPVIPLAGLVAWTERGWKWLPLH